MIEGGIVPDPFWIQEVRQHDETLHSRGKNVVPLGERTPKNDVRKSSWKHGGRTYLHQTDHDTRYGANRHNRSTLSVHKYIREGNIPTESQSHFVTEYEITGRLDAEHVPTVNEYHFTYDPDNTKKRGGYDVWHKGTEKSKKTQKNEGLAEPTIDSYITLLDSLRLGVEKTAPEE